MLGLVFASILLFFLSVKLAQYITTSDCCYRVVASFSGCSSRGHRGPAAR